MALRDRSGGGGVPSGLMGPINTAAKRYGLDPSWLVGIWRIESGSTYPNPFVNSSGYGGLFGTTAWNQSTQTQANLSASILARLLKEKGGDLSQALLAYSGGGYSSVPGEAGGYNPGPSAPAQPARPSGSGGFIGTLEGVGGRLAGDLNPVGGLVSAVSGVFGSAGGISGAFNDVKDVLAFFAWLLQPKNWLRAFEAFLSVILIVLGLFYLGRSAAGEGGTEIKTSDITTAAGLGLVAKGVSRAGPEGAAAVAATTRGRSRGRRRQAKRRPAARRAAPQRVPPVAAAGGESTQVGKPRPMSPEDRVRRARIKQKRRRAKRNAGRREFVSHDVAGDPFKGL